VETKVLLSPIFWPHTFAMSFDDDEEEEVEEEEEEVGGTTNTSQTASVSYANEAYPAEE